MEPHCALDFAKKNPSSICPINLINKIKTISYDYTICLLVLSADQHVHLRDSFERRGKSTVVAKNGIRHCQLSVGIECALRVHSGWDCRDSKMGGSRQKRKMTPWFWGKFRVDGAIKKPLRSGLY